MSLRSVCRSFPIGFNQRLNLLPTNIRFTVRHQKSRGVSYTVPGSETSVLMTGLVTGKAYTMYVTPVDAAGNLGLRDTGTDFVSLPALPQVRWAVNGFSGGLSVPGPV